MGFRHLADVLQNQAQRLGRRTALRFKRHGLYQDLGWVEYAEQARACAAALVEAGIAPGDRVGLLSENRIEWLIADLGLLTAGAVNVPPHAPLTAKQIHYQLQDAGVKWLFVSTRDQRAKIRQIQDQLPALKGIVTFEREAMSATAGCPEYSWAGFLQRGRNALPRVQAELERRHGDLNQDALATIMYTSGTTGNPKGVMLTHGNLVSNAVAMDQASTPRPHDAVLFNWLPFSHIYARTVDHYLSLVTGVPLALAESADTVLLNLAEVQPTHMSSVPRLYEKLLGGLATLEPAHRSKRLRALFGTRIDWIGCGGAPLPPAVAQAFQEAGLLILQGYGLTETAPVISFNRKQHFKLESVGQPIPGVQVQIAPDGEILTRGPHVMKGYWNNPQATAEVLHNGWLHTGDLGRLDDEGFLHITGRKKEILVLSSGKKVVPNYLEGLLLADPLIDQAVIYGEGRKFLTALIVPHWDKVPKALAAEDGALPSEAEILARHPAVLALLAKRINAALAETASWEQVKKFLVLPQPFSVAAEELTVSLKLRRNVVFAKYKAELEALYQ